MKERIFRTEQLVSASLEEAFRFFTDPYNLEKITPPWLNFRITHVSTPEITEGTVISYSLSLHGLPMNWTSKICDWNPPYSFVDVQLKGPYAKWHHLHECLPTGGAIKMCDTVTYRMPFGWIGDFVAGPFACKDIHKIFSYRRDHIDKLFRKSA